MNTSPSRFAQKAAGCAKPRSAALRVSGLIVPRRTLWGVIAVASVALTLWTLLVPELWWDEGWTLSVARTWVETGTYGRLLDGKPTVPGLSASPIVTGAIALSFELLGVGVWQGRLVGVLAALAALYGLHSLARRLYDVRTAWAAVAVSVLMVAHQQVNPLTQARQVLAELPMLALLAASYISLHRALVDGRLWHVMTWLLFGAALVSKAQVLPFWGLSLLGAVLFALMIKQWRIALVCGSTLAAGYCAAALLGRAIDAFIVDPSLPSQPVEGLYGVTAWVMTSLNRLFALKVALLFGIPTLLALVHAGWGLWPALPARNAERPDVIAMRAALVTLTGSWLGWFLFASVGVPRYLFPPVFLGSIFVAAMLDDFTERFNVGATLRRASGLLVRRTGALNGGKALLVVLVMSFAVPQTLMMLGREYTQPMDRAPHVVAEFLNTHTPPDALIETYESELHFLMRRRYHFPPDQAHVELNRRTLLAQDYTLDYDPLAADPDYLVVGRYAGDSGLYDDAIACGAFRPIRSEGRYTIYERVR